MLFKLLLIVFFINSTQSFFKIKICPNKNIPTSKISKPHIPKTITKIQNNDSNDNTTSVKKIPKNPPLTPIMVSLLLFN
jgi:hypothetical protein